MAQIKNLIGNAINDTQLNKLTSKENEFIKELRNIFEKKKMSRIEILGEEQNKTIEKYFYKLLIFLAFASSIFGTIETGHRLKTVWKKDPLSNLKRRLLFFLKGFCQKLNMM